MEYCVYIVVKETGFKHLSINHVELSEIFDFIEKLTAICPDEYLFIIDNVS